MMKSSTFCPPLAAFQNRGAVSILFYPSPPRLIHIYNTRFGLIASISHRKLFTKFHVLRNHERGGQKKKIKKAKRKKEIHPKHFDNSVVRRPRRLKYIAHHGSVWTRFFIDANKLYGPHSLSKKLIIHLQRDTFTSSPAVRWLVTLETHVNGTLIN